MDDTYRNYQSAMAILTMRSPIDMLRELAEVNVYVRQLEAEVANLRSENEVLRVVITDAA